MSLPPCEDDADGGEWVTVAATAMPHFAIVSICFIDTLQSAIGYFSLGKDTNVGEWVTVDVTALSELAISSLLRLVNNLLSVTGYPYFCKIF